jgi:hypothetical protein
VIAAQQVVKQLIAGLNAARIDHMLVGSFARNFYAEPRSTKDADVVLSVPGGSLRPLLDALGPEFQVEQQMTFKTNTGTMRSRLAHVASGFTIELFFLSNDVFDQERFKRRRAIRYEDAPTFILTAEDVIVTKLRWARRKDLDDVRDVIAVQGDAALDWEYIHKWTAIHGTRAKLDEIRASIPPLD